MNPKLVKLSIVVIAVAAAIVCVRWYSSRTVVMSRIVFPSRESDLTDLYFVDKPGEKPKVLCEGKPASRTYPAIAPGGALIAYVEQGSNLAKLHVMRGDCSDDRVLAESPTLTTISNPQFSPDGSRIAYEGFVVRAPPNALRPRSRAAPSGDTEIFVVSADGASPPVDISNDSADDGGPAWSRDGRSIAYVSRRDDRWGDLITVAPDGALAATVATKATGHPAWAADGRIAFGVKTDASFAIATVKDGVITLLVDATNPLIAQEGAGLWLGNTIFSPDDSHIAFSGHKREANVNTQYFSDRVFLAKTDGTKVQAVVRGQALCPTFSPDGKLLTASVPASGPAPDVTFAFPMNGGDREALVKTASCIVWTPPAR